MSLSRCLWLGASWWRWSWALRPCPWPRPPLTIPYRKLTPLGLHKWGGQGQRGKFIIPGHLSQWQSRLESGWLSFSSILLLTADLYDQEVPAPFLHNACFCPISAIHGLYEPRERVSYQSLNFLKHSREGETRSLDVVSFQGPSELNNLWGRVKLCCRTPTPRQIQVTWGLKQIEFLEPFMRKKHTKDYK